MGFARPALARGGVINLTQVFFNFVALLCLALLKDFLIKQPQALTGLGLLNHLFRHTNFLLN